MANETVVHRPVVVAPTFNNSGHVVGVLTRVLRHGFPLIVVDDGSTDTTSSLLSAFAAGRQDRVIVLRHRSNRGKAAALRYAFAVAAEHGFTHAVSIDTDGQLDPDEIPMMLEASRRQPFALVVGTRDFHKPGYPARSRLGRRISNHLVRIESGVRIGDSQCGMRVYPVAFTQAVKCRSQRFGFETEIIARAGWAGCPVVEVPVTCRYLPAGERVSHFKPLRDSLRALRMHGRLVCRALCPWSHTQWPGELVAVNAEESLLKHTLQWISPRQAWQQLRHDHSGRAMFATGLALGVFIANLPLYGLQTVMCLYAAKRLHLHPVSVVAGSQVSTPPVCFALAAGAIYLGHLILHGSLPTLGGQTVTTASVAAMAPTLMLAWLVGAVLVGAVLAAATFFIALACFRYFLPQAAHPGQQP